MSGHKDSVSPSSRDVEERQVTNALRSKTRSLPNETLSYIFQHACPKLDVFDKLSYSKSRFHLVLRLVSTLWYSVVHSTPQLWNSLYIFDITREGRMDYIKLCLDRSGQLSLHITFHPFGGSRNPHHANDNWAHEIMERNLHRIESLQSLIATPEWMAKMIPNMLNLRALNFVDAPRLPKGPSLERMRLKAARLDGLDKEPRMTSITYLDLQWIPIDSSIMLLFKCPNLVELSCLYHCRKTSDISVRLESTLVLDQLSTFSWSAPAHPSDIQLQDQLFERLRVPALQRLCLHHYTMDTNTATFTFLSRLPKSMKELEFRSIDNAVNDRMLRNIVNDAGISRIHVYCCGPSIFSTLSETTNEGTFRFPNLACIEVEYPGSPAQYPHAKSWIGEKLALMLQDRAGTTDRFTFVYRNHRSIEWDALTWGLFKELKEGGLDLTIIDSGDVVDVEAKYEEEILKDWTSDSDSDSD